MVTELALIAVTPGSEDAFEAAFPAALAVALGSTYGLRSANAVHLATAVAAGADRFITNNSRDFSRSIKETTVTYPGDLARS